MDFSFLIQSCIVSCVKSKIKKKTYMPKRKGRMRLTSVLTNLLISPSFILMQIEINFCAKYKSVSIVLVYRLNEEMTRGATMCYDAINVSSHHLYSKRTALVTFSICLSSLQSCRTSSVSKMDTSILPSKMPSLVSSVMRLMRYCVCWCNTSAMA